MSNEKTDITAMLKSEYAKRIGIPASTLRRYCNQLYLSQLQEMDYTISQKWLTPRQIAWLNTKLVVDF